MHQDKLSLVLGTTRAVVTKAAVMERKCRTEDTAHK